MPARMTAPDMEPDIAATVADEAGTGTSEGIGGRPESNASVGAGEFGAGSFAFGVTSCIVSVVDEDDDVSASEVLVGFVCDEAMKLYTTTLSSPPQESLGFPVQGVVQLSEASFAAFEDILTPQ